MAFDTFTDLTAGQSLAGQAWDNGGLAWAALTWLQGNGDGTVSFIPSQPVLANYIAAAGLRGCAVRFVAPTGRNTGASDVEILVGGAPATSQYYPGEGARISIGSYGYLTLKDVATNTELAAKPCGLVEGQEYWLEGFKTLNVSGKEYTGSVYASSNGVRGALLATISGSLPTAMPDTNRRVVIGSTQAAGLVKISRVESVPLTVVAAPTGTITSQPPPDGQSQRFVLTTTDATSGIYTLTGSNGGVTVGPLPFAVENNAADFKHDALEPGSYAPTLTVNGPGGSAAVSGTSSFTIGAVDGSGEIPAAPGGVTPLVSADFAFDYSVLNLVAADFAFDYSVLNLVGADFAFAYAVADVELVSKDQTFNYQVLAALVGAEFAFSFSVESVEAPDGISNFTPSKARTLKALAASGHFEGGEFWDLTDPMRPVGRKDPDAKIDVSIDWEDVLSDISDILGGIEYKLDGFTYSGERTLGTVTSIIVSGGAGPVSSVTFVMSSASIPPRVEERTVHLKIGDQ